MLLNYESLFFFVGQNTSSKGVTPLVTSVLAYMVTREIHPLDPQAHRHSMLVPGVCAPRVTRCSLGKYWSHDFFRKRLIVVDRELAIQSLISFRCLYLGQIGCQGDGVSRQPGWGTQVIYDSCVGGSEI